MPKADSPDDSVAPARAPRRRTTTPRVASSRTRAPRASRVVDSVSAAGVSTTPRRAPTAVATRATTPRSKVIQLGILSVVTIACIAGSIAIGFSDAGTIDVAATIKARNERIESGQASEEELEVSAVVVPVPEQNPLNLPNGGLRGRGSSNRDREVSQTENTEIATATTTIDVIATTTPVTNDPSSVEVTADESVTNETEVSAAEVSAPTPVPDESSEESPAAPPTTNATTP